MSFMRVAGPATKPAAPAVTEGEIARRIEHEVGLLREKAEAEGRARGAETGRAAAQGSAAAALDGAIAALHEAMAQLATPLAQSELDLAEMVTDLSFELASHIVGVEISADPKSLQLLVARLLREAAAERGAGQNILLRVNPADHEVLQKSAAFADATLLADPAITPGGALVEITAQGGDPIDKIEWDATLETRLESVRSALGLRPTAKTRKMR